MGNKTSMSIIEIEGVIARVSSAVRSIGDEKTIFAMREAEYILAEVRHFAQCISGLDDHGQKDAAERLSVSLASRYCEKAMQAA